MNKKIFLGAICSLFLIVICLFMNETFDTKKIENIKTNTLEATVLSLNEGRVTVQDDDHIIYTFSIEDSDLNVGDRVLLSYSGKLDKNKNLQEGKITEYKTINVFNENGVPSYLLDKGIFSDYYTLAYNKLNELSLDEKIGQLFLVRYPDSNQVEILEKNGFGGYVFFAKDFENKSTSDVQKMMSTLQKSANIPILTAVDEEGGKVVRVSSNPKLVSEKFKSSKELYNEGGLELIKKDTKEKSDILYNLGLNLNLAPVVDVSTNANDYMYPRALGENTSITSDYARDVIEASKGTGVSYTLKHFPGYGNNSDTHTSSSIDNRSYEDIVNNDLPPFEAGINAGAEAVLVSHNIVNSIDSANPASLSADVHNLLRNTLGFTGVIMTDDIAMGAASSISDVTVKALLAGNDLIITTDYEDSIKQIKAALNNGYISETLIDNAAFKVLAWKYYKGLMFDSAK